MPREVRWSRNDKYLILLIILQGLIWLYMINIGLIPLGIIHKFHVA